MSPLHDPGVWMIVALWACVHITITLLRRFGGKPHWMSAWGLLPTLLLSYTSWAIKTGNYSYPSDGRFFVISGLMLVICGMLVAVCLKNRKLVWTPAAAAFVGVIALHGWNFSVVASKPYMSSIPYWSDDEGYTVESPPMEMLAGDATDSTATITTAGYLDEDRFKWIGFDSRGPYTWNQPQPLWHTAITGICRRTEHTYRVWIPSGPIKNASNGAKLIAVESTGDPVGKLGQRKPYQ